MSSSDTPVEPDLVLAYLLDELPERELARIDRRLFEDEAFAAAFEAARVDLLDAYARGKLAAGTSERARRAIERSGQDRMAVSIARALHEQLGNSAPAHGAPEQAVTRLHKRWSWAVPLAACVLASFGAWALWPKSQSPDRIEQVRTTGKRAPFVLLLRPEALRGAAARPVRLPAALRALEVQVLIGRAPARYYEVRVEGPAGAVTYPHLVPRRFKGIPFVQFSLPATWLSSGTYRFELLREGSPRNRAATDYTVTLQSP
jgi:hypothetical protein